MSALFTLITALLRIFLPAMSQASMDTAEDGSVDTDLRGRLRKRIRSTWGKLPVLLPPLLLTVFLSGCGTRTVYVPDGAPVRLRETVRNARVWVLGKNGKPVAGEMDIPEGWYALPTDQ